MKSAATYYVEARHLAWKETAPAGYLTLWELRSFSDSRHSLRHSVQVCDFEVAVADCDFELVLREAAAAKPLRASGAEKVRARPSGNASW